VKLLLDENLSERIISRIGDLFPGSTHVNAVGLREADDRAVWEWAKQHGFPRNAYGIRRLGLA
jgi:predicted nuclease of predicted toxin-antitoxin system